jgi:hypothetical protein
MGGLVRLYHEFSPRDGLQRDILEKIDDIAAAIIGRSAIKGFVEWTGNGECRELLYVKAKAKIKTCKKEKGGEEN